VGELVIRGRPPDPYVKNMATACLTRCSTPDLSPPTRSGVRSESVSFVRCPSVKGQLS
jgi:hypothetical protein